MQESFANSISMLNRNPFTEDLVKLVTTKRWGMVWCVDGVVCVIDPRVGERRSVLRADKARSVSDNRPTKPYLGAA